MVARNAEPRPPVESPHSDVDASCFAQRLGVPICVREVNDAQSATSTQHPHGLIQGLSAPLGPRDVVNRQVAHYDVERRGRKRQVARVSVDKVDSVANSIHDSVVLGGKRTIPTLITTPPNVRSYRFAFRQPVRCKEQHSTPTATHVQHIFVTAKAQFV